VVEIPDCSLRFGKSVEESVEKAVKKSEEKSEEKSKKVRNKKARNEASEVPAGTSGPGRDR
jgi:hypothetical protein